MPDSVIVAGGSKLVCGSLTLDGTVQNLPFSAFQLIGLNIQADPSNSGNVSIVATEQGEVGFILTPGASFALDANSNQVPRFQGTVNDVVYWSGLTQ